MNVIKWQRNNTITRKIISWLLVLGLILTLPLGLAYPQMQLK